MLTSSSRPQRINSWLRCLQMSQHLPSRYRRRSAGTVEDKLRHICLWMLFIGFRLQNIDSSSPRAEYMHRSTWSALVQVMACHLVGAKPLLESMVNFCQLNTLENKLQWKSTLHANAAENVVCEWRPFHPRVDDEISRKVSAFQELIVSLYGPSPPSNSS